MAPGIIAQGGSEAPASPLSRGPPPLAVRADANKLSKNTERPLPQGAQPQGRLRSWKERSWGPHAPRQGTHSIGPRVPFGSTPGWGPHSLSAPGRVPSRIRSAPPLRRWQAPRLISVLVLLADAAPEGLSQHRCQPLDGRRCLLARPHSHRPGPSPPQPGGSVTWHRQAGHSLISNRLRGLPGAALGTCKP